MNIWKKETEKKEISSEFLRIEVAELNLSVRSYNCLKRAGCNTIGDILALTDEDENGLRKIRNLGKRSEEEIIERIRQFREEYKETGDAGPGNSGAGKRVLIKPAKKWWAMEIESFHLSQHALTKLKQKGIHYVGDLYATNPKQEPGWYAVRELFEKIPISPGSR